MAIEYFAGEIAATAAGIAYDTGVAINNHLKNIRSSGEMNEWYRQGYNDGIDDAAREWQPKYQESVELSRHNTDIFLRAEREQTRLEKRLKNEIRDKIYFDCQRFGYAEAIGLLKGFCDYGNYFTKDYRGKVKPFDRFYHPTGEIVSLYEEPTVTTIKLADFPDINDEAHKFLYKGELKEGEGVLSVYEEYFLRGFWHRATELWKKAEAENDKLTLEAIGSLKTIKGRCFWQKPEDREALAKCQKEGHDAVLEKMVPFWEDQIEKTTKLVKEKNLSERDVRLMQAAYNNEENRVRDRIKEEKARYAEKGINKTYFI